MALSSANLTKLTRQVSSLSSSAKNLTKRMDAVISAFDNDNEAARIFKNPDNYKGVTDEIGAIKSILNAIYDTQATIEKLVTDCNNFITKQHRINEQ